MCLILLSYSPTLSFRWLLLNLTFVTSIQREAIQSEHISHFQLICEQIGAEGLKPLGPSVTSQHFSDPTPCLELNIVYDVWIKTLNLVTNTLGPLWPNNCVWLDWMKMYLHFFRLLMKANLIFNFYLNMDGGDSWCLFTLCELAWLFTSCTQGFHATNERSMCPGTKLSSEEVVLPPKKSQNKSSHRSTGTLRMGFAGMTMSDLVKHRQLV